MTDISTKGLLPQLVDVLHALADSQQVLAQKVRSAHLEALGTGNTPAVLELLPALPIPLVTALEKIEPTPPRTAPATPKPSPVPVMTVAEPVIDRPSQVPAQPASGPVEPACLVPLGLPSASDVQQVPAALDPDWVVPNHTDQLHAPEWPSTPRAEVTGAEAVNRSYNFFDELDARLASLQDGSSGNIEN